MASSILLMRPQAMVQPKQAWLVTRCFLAVGRSRVAMAFGLMSLAPSNWQSMWLRVGRPPTSLITFISTCVPMAGRPWPVTALSASTFLAVLTAAMKAFRVAQVAHPWCRAPQWP